jgi:outer membrane lipoprotein SlyB
MRKVPVAVALSLLVATALPLAGAGHDCSKLTEAQVYAKSTKTIHDGNVPVTYRVCVCDAEPVVELIADGKVVGVVTGGECGEATGRKIEVRASPERGATVGYTVVTPAH